MASIGNHLRELRERHGVALEDLAQTTRISQRLLESLEADDFDALPAGPFARGFIRSYCQALGESAEEPLALHAATTTASGPRREAQRPPRAKRSLAPVLVSLALLVILGAALAAVTLVLRSGRNGPPAPRSDAPPGTARDSRATEQSTALTGSVVYPPGPMAPEGGASPSAPASTRTPVPTVAAPRAADRRWPSTSATATPYRLVARASDTTWIRVRMEGGRMTEETIPAGEAREWISNRPFELRIGNAGSVSLELNGQPLPPLSLRGTGVLNLVVPAEP